LTKKNNIKIGIIGAGGWGTALSVVLNCNGHQSVIWTHEENVVAEINHNRTNSTYLPGIIIPGGISATSKSSELMQCDMAVIAVPTQFIRQILSGHNFGLKGKQIVCVSKGIEQNTMMRVSEILHDILYLEPELYTVISGPSHAEEVARKTPTTVVAASVEHDSAKFVQDVFSTPFFRVYTSDDVIGCEIGGSLKNVIAIAAGVIDGLGLGDNTKAALITRGLAEISRLGITLGANPLTFSGLSGLGDLVVTCNSRHSRNRFVGEQIGKGKKIEQIISEMQMVAEGISTTRSAHFLALKHNVELPIVEQVYKIIFEDINPSEAVRELMVRQYKREWWW